jgi:hypothetical protein
VNRFVANLDVKCCARVALTYLLVAWVGVVDLSATVQQHDATTATAYESRVAPRPPLNGLARQSAPRVVQFFEKSNVAHLRLARIGPTADSIRGKSTLLFSQSFSTTQLNRSAELGDLPLIKLRL